MTGSQQVGALLIASGMLYALLYVWWLRRSSNRSSPVGMSSDIDAIEPVAEQVAGPPGASTVELPRVPTPAWVVDTSMDASVQDFSARAVPLMGVSIQDSPVGTEAAANTGAFVQDSPVGTEGAADIGASIQDSPVETEIVSQNEGEAAMPQDGNP